MKPPYYTKAIYITRDICGCGFGVLKDDIPLGTVYELDEERVVNLTFICGGCGRKQTVKGIFAKAREAGGHAGFLPLGIFQ